jgi:hypothetical protein
MTWLIMLSVAVAVMAASIFVLAPGARPTDATRTRLVRQPVRCPARGARATVEFIIETNGGDTFVDVLSCSLLPGHRRLTCGRVCRSISVARFADVGAPATPPPSTSPDPAAPALWCVGGSAA